MRAVIQRVSSASVSVDNQKVSEIGYGYMVLLGISDKDDEKDIDYIVDKLLNIRLFEDDLGKMNISLLDKNYELLVVSQFTLYGDARKGRRPSFIRSAKSDDAKQIYEKIVNKLKNHYNNKKIKTGIFQAMMKVDLVNDGPVTILLDSDKEF